MTHLIDYIYNTKLGLKSQQGCATTTQELARIILERSVLYPRNDIVNRDLLTIERSIREQQLQLEHKEDKKVVILIEKLSVAYVLIMLYPTIQDQEMDTIIKRFTVSTEQEEEHQKQENLKTSTYMVLKLGEIMQQQHADVLLARNVPNSRTKIHQNQEELPMLGNQLREDFVTYLEDCGSTVTIDSFMADDALSRTQIKKIMTIFSWTSTMSLMSHGLARFTFSFADLYRTICTMITEKLTRGLNNPNNSKFYSIDAEELVLMTHRFRAELDDPWDIMLPQYEYQEIHVDNHLSLLQMHGISRASKKKTTNKQDSSLSRRNQVFKVTRRVKLTLSNVVIEFK